MSNGTRIKTSQIPLVKAAILSKRQDGKCALCSRPLTVSGACLDHDHYTGQIRGVLCRNCNGIEGKIKNLVVRAGFGKDMRGYLRYLSDYWEFHSTDRTGLLHPTHLTPDEKRLKRNAKARKARAAKKKA